jgi:hypothetical protein
MSHVLCGDQPGCINTLFPAAIPCEARCKCGPISTILRPVRGNEMLAHVMVVGR